MGHGSDLTSGSSYGSLYWVGGIGNKVQAGNKDLTLEAAWLYAQYREGEVPATTNTEADALQLAIWDVQGEVAYASHSGSSYRFNDLTKSGYFYVGSSVYNLYTSLLADVPVDLTGLGGVSAVNLYTDRYYDRGGYYYSGNAQDVLTYTAPEIPTPEPTSMMLLGTGLIGLAGLVCRRLRK